MWFTSYSGDPQNWSPRHGYSELFKTTVVLIRDQFKLKNLSPGEDINSSGFWREYELQGKKVRVQVTRFRFRDMGRYSYTVTPVFYLDTIIEVWDRPGPAYRQETYVDQQAYENAMPWWLTILDAYFPDWEWVKERVRRYRGVRNVRRTRSIQLPTRGPRWIRFFNYPIKIVFPERYPHVPPKFQVDHRKFTSQDPDHDQHLFNDGWLCILAGYDDWNYPRDTVVSGLNAALDWAVLHYKNYGW